MARLVVAGTDPEARRLALAVRANPGATLLGCVADRVGDVEELAAELAVTPAGGDRLPRRTEGVIVSPELAARTSWATRWVEQGVPVLVGSPIGLSIEAIDALIDAATRHRVLAGVAEPTLFAPPLVAALRSLGAIGRLTHLEVRATTSADAPDGAAFRRAGAATMAVLLALGGTERTAIGPPSDEQDRWRAPVLIDGEPLGEVSVTAGGSSVPVLWAQAASATHTIHLDLWPDSRLEVNGEEAMPHHGLDPTDPVSQLRLAGYRGLVDGFAGAIDGRGGDVCPLGFGRRIVELGGV